VPFVVIDDNPEVREALEEMEVLHIEGRPSEDQVLREAGIERARAVIACIDSDAENIFATLSARELRPDIRIVARAAEEASERKLRRAGADEVVSPYKTSGSAMAELALDSDRGRRTAREPLTA
jgi:voltage-gated potassium channel